MKKTFLLIFLTFFVFTNKLYAEEFKGSSCPLDLQINQNLRTGAYNGRYHSYTKGTVREAHILQAHLNRLGFASGKVDGKLGPISDAAIKRMQNFLKVKPDGIVGPITRRVLNNSCTNIDELDQKTENPVCVYNHAYQENYKNDTIGDILKNAENCYVLIDPLENNAAKYISQIQQKNNQVGCYMSAGTGENWRDDFMELKPYLANKAWGEWNGEYFVSHITPELKTIMKKRIQNFVNLGCDWVEFDNMDWGDDDDHRKSYKLKTTKKQSEKYIEDLCIYTQSLGMKCMAKSTTYGNNIFDGVTYESYSNEMNWWNADELKKILSKNKPGIIVHYYERSCDHVQNEYIDIYDEQVLFICEDKNKKEYKHYKN